MKISIIVPVYNSVAYLDRCINSIKAQTYLNWELIMVDDGSKDDSWNLMQQHALHDKRIKVLHQENAGPGIARNTGLAHATGEYIVFLDSDDFIDSNYLSLLSQHDEDVVFIDVQAVKENGKVVRNEFLSVYKNISKEDFLRSQMTGKINWGGVRKASKRVLLNENNIQYTEHKIGEEAVFSFLVTWHAKTIAFIKKPVYYYYQRDDSQSHLKMDNPWGEVSLVIRNVVKSKGCYETLADTCNAFIFSAAAVSADRLVCNYNWTNYLSRVKELRHMLSQNIDKSYPIDYTHMSTKAKLLGLLLQSRLYTMIWIISKIKKIVA